MDNRYEYALERENNHTSLKMGVVIKGCLRQGLIVGGKKGQGNQTGPKQISSCY